MRRNKTLVHSSTKICFRALMVRSCSGHTVTLTSPMCALRSRSDLGNVVAFTVPGESNSWYPQSDGPLASGGELTFEGIMTFHSSVHDQAVSIRALSDSCSGDEFVPDYCRVEESDEGNNVSSAITVSLP